MIVCNRRGALYARAEHLDVHRAALAQRTNTRGLRGPANEVLQGADVLVGVSAPGAVLAAAVRQMAPGAIVFAMAYPVPEVHPEEVRDDVAIIATGRSDYPNQINDVLAFPGVFKGALEVRARTINEEMKLAAAHAIARVIGEDELHADYIIPSVFNRHVAESVAHAVAAAAVTSGVARRERGTHAPDDDARNGHRFRSAEGRYRASGNHGPRSVIGSVGARNPVCERVDMAQALPVIQPPREVPSREYYDRILRYVRSVVRDDREAEDLAQETFLRAHRARDSLRDPDAVLPWLYSVATHVCLDRLRQRTRQARAQSDLDPEALSPPDPAPSAGLLAEQADMSACVEAYVSELSDGYRAVLLMHDVKGLTAREIGELLGTSTGSVKIRLHRARRELRAALEVGCEFAQDERGTLVCDPKASRPNPAAPADRHID